MSDYLNQWVGSVILVAPIGLRAQACAAFAQASGSQSDAQADCFKVELAQVSNPSEVVACACHTAITRRNLGVLPALADKLPGSSWYVTRLYDDAEGVVRMSPKEYLDSLGLMVAGSDADEETT